MLPAYVDQLELVGCFIRLRVQLVVDEGTMLKFLDLGQSVNERAFVILSPVVRLFNDERVANLFLARPVDLAPRE